MGKSRDTEEEEKEKEREKNLTLFENLTLFDFVVNFLKIYLTNGIT
jgi:hypothetical protein